MISESAVSYINSSWQILYDPNAGLAAAWQDDVKSGAAESVHLVNVIKTAMMQV